MKRFFDILAGLFLSGVAAVFGFQHIGDKALENDEATSFFIAQLDWSGMFESFATSEANGSPFYLSLYFWKGFGDSEQVLRLLPWLFGIGVPFLLFFLLSRMFDRWVAFGAALLLAINAFFVANLQELRTYSLSVLLGTAATLAFVRWVEGRRIWWGIGYILLGVLLVYSHFIGALVLVAHVLSLLVTPSDVRLRDVAWVYLPMAVLLLPVAWFILFNDVGQVDWIKAPTSERVMFSLRELTGRDDSLLLVIYAAGLMGGLAALIAALISKGRSISSWRHTLVLLWAVLPVGGTLLISQFKPLFQGRYVIGSLPGVVACLALGIAWLASLLPGRVLRAAAMVALTAVVAAVSLPPLLDRDSTAVTGIWEEKAQIVAAEAQPDDGYVFYAPTIIRPFGFYAGLYSDRRLSLDEEGIIYPPVDWLGFSKTRFNPPLETIEDRVAQRDRVWLIEGATGDRPRQRENDALVDLLRETCEETESVRPNILLFSGCRT